jgi:hypothetical protein
VLSPVWKKTYRRLSWSRTEELGIERSQIIFQEIPTSNIDLPTLASFDHIEDTFYTYGSWTSLMWMIPSIRIESVFWQGRPAVACFRTHVKQALWIDGIPRKPTAHPNDGYRNS